MAVGAVPRIALASGILPSVLRPFVWSDVAFIWERGARSGQLPYRDVPFEYPPLVGYAWGAIETVAASEAVHVLAWAGVQAVAAAVVAYVLAREAGSSRALLFWSLSPQLLLYGSLNFETIAVAPLVVAIGLARRGRPIGSAVALAVGTAVKLFPAAALPVVLARPFLARDRRAVVAVAAFAVVLAAAFVPGATAPFSTLTSLRQYSVGIEPNFDSFWGLVRSIVLTTGWDPRDAIVMASLAGTAVTYLLLVVPAMRRSADPAVTAGLAVAAVLIWARLYSPQYALWILPFFALAGLSARTFALLTFADVAVFLTVYPLTLVDRPPGDPAAPLLGSALAAAVVLRQAALLLTARELWRRSRAPVRP